MTLHMREQLLRAVLAHAQGEIEKHKVNVNVYLENPVGIGEHQDIQEAIEIELGHIADYHDKLEMLNKFFIAKKGEENDKEISE